MQRQSEFKEPLNTDIDSIVGPCYQTRNTPPRSKGIVICARSLMVERWSYKPDKLQMGARYWFESNRAYQFRIRLSVVSKTYYRIRCYAW